MIVIKSEDIHQGSDAWLKLRSGVVSCSCMDKIITKSGTPSKQAEKYMYQLAGEAILGKKEETYSNHHMLRGIELEPEARMAFEFITDLEVTEVGFVFKDKKKRVGCSPDGLIGDDGGVEFKCPSLPVHCEYLDKDELPSTYFQQVHGSMYVTGRSYWYFCSYYPGLKTFIKKIERNNEWCDKLHAVLGEFNAKLTETIEKIRESE